MKLIMLLTGLSIDKLEIEFTVIKEDLKRVKEVIKEKLGIDLT